VGEPFEAIRREGGSAVLSVSAAVDAAAFVYRLARAGGRERLSWRDRSGKRLEPYFDFGGDNVELSPDGRRAVVVRTSDLWLIDLPRALPTRFTSGDGFEGSPAWSPDSTKVAFGHRSGVQLKALTGAESTLLQGEKRERVALPADWSRDGKYLLYRTIGATTNGDLWALPLVGEAKPFPVVETRFDETRGQFSPDGRWVSYESNESGLVPGWDPRGRLGQPRRRRRRGLFSGVAIL
jgi:Tol biopolymer transport system component